MRLLPVNAAQVTPDEAKHVARVDIAQIGLIRSDANHRVVRLDDSGSASDLTLPDDFAPKTPMDAAALQGRLSLQAFQSKKAKVGELIAPEQFFVFVSGNEPDRLALALLARTSVFLDLKEQLAAMAAACQTQQRSNDTCVPPSCFRGQSLRPSC